jgi:hypothetical protein
MDDISKGLGNNRGAPELPPELPPEPLERREYDSPTLMRQHPPVVRNPNKQVVFDIACPDRTSGGHISYSRWAKMPLPATVDPARAAGLLAVRDGFFDYEPVPVPVPEPVPVPDPVPEPIPGPRPAVEWHVNFADPKLFYAYSSALFAQDEMQVAEHPVLGSLRADVGRSGDRPPPRHRRGRSGRHRRTDQPNRITRPGVGLQRWQLTADGEGPVAARSLTRVSRGRSPSGFMETIASLSELAAISWSLDSVYVQRNVHLTVHA